MMKHLEIFLQESVFGVIVLGACGSILGYIVILLYKRFVDILRTIFRKENQTSLDKFKEKYILENVEVKVLMNESNINKGFIFTKLIMDLVFYLGISIGLSIIFIQLLLFSVEIKSELFKYFAFLIGFISSYPTYKIGYLRGGYKLMFKKFIRFPSNSINIQDLEQEAIDKFKNKKSKK